MLQLYNITIIQLQVDLHSAQSQKEKHINSLLWEIPMNKRGKTRLKENIEMGKRNKFVRVLHNNPLGDLGS